MANLSLDVILEQITDLCKKYQVEHLYLFGSYATGTAAPTSDIDVVVEGGANLGALREEVNRIPTLKKIDLFDYNRCENPHLREDMDRYGRKIY